MWPMTTLHPVWLREAKWVNIPDLKSDKIVKSLLADTVGMNIHETEDN